MSMSTDIGNRTESIACGYLSAGGVKIKQRNYRCRFGEIDIIAEHGDTLCFIEVRYRKNRAYGDSAESVTKHKRRKIFNSARYYLTRNAADNRRPCRFDIVSMHGNMDAPEINWCQNAFTANEAG